MEKKKITIQGKLELEAEYQELEKQRDVVIRELQEARAQGDLSENADYDAAKKKQGEIESRISQIEAILKNHEIIVETSKAGEVGLGKVVVIKDLSTNETSEYRIVGTVEANPFEGKISYECILAKAINGKKEGDIVEVKSKTPYKVQILEVR